MATSMARVATTTERATTHVTKNGPRERAVSVSDAAGGQLTPTALQAEATPLYCAEPDP